MSEQAIVALVFIVGGFLVVILMIYFAFRFETGTSQTEASTSSEGGQTLEQRAGSLTTALSDSAHVIQEIETDIEARREIAEKMQNDIEIYERIKDLNCSEVEAVAQAVEGEDRKEDGRF
jgi:uncharacterized coiled-coil protein SlyX